MLRLLKGDVISSDDTYTTIFTRSNFRSDEDWERVQKAAMKRDGLSEAPTSVEMEKRYSFEEIKIIPQEWRRDLLESDRWHSRSKSPKLYEWNCTRESL